MKGGFLRIKMEQKVESMISPILITRYARAKGDYIASRVKKICKGLDLPTYEIAFYLLSTKEEAKRGRPVIRDIYIAQEQEVWPDYCAISGEGDIMSIRDIRDNLDKRIVGWGHSHGDIPVCFSSRDRRTFDNFLVDYGMFIDAEFDKSTKEKSISFIEHKGKKCIRVGDDKSFLIHSNLFNLFSLPDVERFGFSVIEHSEVNVQYTYAMVFNAVNQTPYTMVIYGIGDETRIIENMPFEEVDDGTKIRFDGKSIDAAIRERVVQIRERSDSIRSKMDKDYEDLRRLIDESIEIIDSNFVVGDGKSHYSPLKTVRDRLKSAEEIKDNFLDGQFLQEEAEEIYRRIDEDIKDLAGHLLGKRAYLDMILKSINKKEATAPSISLPLLGIRSRNWKARKEACEYLIQFVDSYHPDIHGKKDGT